MTALDWFALLHPVLVILFVYPVVGATIRLGILVREKRLGITQQPALVPREHADHGRWVTAGVVVAVLIALVYSFISKAMDPGAAFLGGTPRLALLLLVAAGTLVALLALLKVKRAPLRASFTLLTWAGLLGLGSQPEVWRLSDNPFSGAFWSSHYWSGVLLTGLFLFNLAARPEITRQLAWRRLHVGSNVLILVLLAVMAITGSRDLLEIPPMAQKPPAAPAAAAPGSADLAAPSQA
ncbi:MAG: DUF4079 domain-containing protein [Cyanobacteria bacterium M_surface_10_m2_179]|nr:DUF4079 domain-containing protein [Cyanobacteria bacterium M_surface_10_m2_179]